MDVRCFAISRQSEQGRLYLFAGVPTQNIPTSVEYEAIPTIIEAAVANEARRILRECENTLRGESNLPGVGEGVAEIVEAKMPRAEIYRTYITGGINPTLDGHEIRLPKQQLVSTLLAAFDRDRLYLSKNSRELDAMLSELETFEIHVSESGADQYGAFKTGSHDDLVVALGLAVWLGNELGTRTVMMW